MPAFVPVNSALLRITQGVHLFASHTFTVALCNAANAPVAANAVLADLTQISYANLSSRALTLTAAETFNTRDWRVRFADLVLSASGGNVAPFRYAVIYNDTPTSPADPLLGWWDYGADVTITDGNSFTLDFTDANQTVLSLAW